MNVSTGVEQVDRNNIEPSQSTTDGNLEESGTNATNYLIIHTQNASAVYICDHIVIL